MFRKILLTILCLFVLSGSAFATDYFLDLSHDQASGGDGTTMQTDGGADDAFKTFAEAYASIGADDVCWIRRVTTVTQGADVSATQNGTAAAPAIWIGWPRDALTITSATWTNGSTTVDIILPASMTWSTVCGRWVTGPDGFDYLITLVTDTNTFTVDRPYAGSTVTLTDGAASIKADELPQGVSEPADTDSWSADGDDLALIDFDDANFDFVLKNYNQIWNIELKDSNDGSGVVYVNSVGSFINGCLISQTVQDKKVVSVYAGLAHFNRCIFKGSSPGSNFYSQIFAIGTGGAAISNSAVYSMGYNGIKIEHAYVALNNVNVGVESANRSDDLYFDKSSGISRDTKCGGTNGEVVFNTGSLIYDFISLDHNKVLGSFKHFFYKAGVSEKVAVTGTNANKKLSDNVIEITPETTSTNQFKEIEQKVKVFESRKTYDAGTYNIKLWIYNDTGNTLNDTTFSEDILMRCRAEAGNYGDATTEYVSMPWTYSDEIDILDAADADDWDYLQCDSVVVDQASKIYCEVLVSTYDAEADVILIDPSTVNP